MRREQRGLSRMGGVGKRSILLYDGVCALCNGVVRFALRRDHEGRLRFAPLQSEVARAILVRHGYDPTKLETVVLVKNAGEADERLMVRSDAMLELWRELGLPWRVTAGVIAIVPRQLRDWMYSGIARVRYATFGRYEACPIPREEDRRKFLE
jgi:predicted DCC family thiol-disulfide oxidoreductase YuxK